MIAKPVDIGGEAGATKYGYNDPSPIPQHWRIINGDGFRNHGNPGCLAQLANSTSNVGSGFDGHPAR